jgi:diadenylate cyclase
VAVGDPILDDMLAQLAPGTALREAIDRIIEQGCGALVVLGHDEGVESVCSGGFWLGGVAFSPPRLAELSKMDGGIVLDDGCQRIMAANVHFLPNPDLPTDETGSRHRTAERLALHTDKPVIAVSEGRSMATLFFGGRKQEVARSSILDSRTIRDMATLERLRQGVDQAIEALKELGT